MNLSDLASHANGVTGAKNSGKDILLVAKDDAALESAKLKFNELFGEGRSWVDPRRPMPSRFIESPGKPLRYQYQFGKKGSIFMASAKSGAEQIFNDRDGNLLQKYHIVATVGQLPQVVDMAQGHGFRVVDAEIAFDPPEKPKPGPRKAKDLPPPPATPSIVAVLAENENLKARLDALEKKLEGKPSKKAEKESN